MSFETKPFDTKTMSRDDWNKYHEYRRKRHLETTPEDPCMSNEVIEKSFIQDTEDDMMYLKRYSIFNSEDNGKSKMIGYVGISSFSEKNPSFEGNKHNVQFDISILKDYRKKGIATQNLKYVIDFAKEHNKTVAHTQTFEDDGREFMKKIGAKVALSAKENRLQMADVDWNMVKQWVSEAESLNPNTKIKRFTKVPEEIIEQYSHVLTETANQQPFDDLDIKDFIITPEVLRKFEEKFNNLGYISYTMITVESDGEISGLTEIMHNPEKKIMLSQGLTGVVLKHRGRKLGKWLKGLTLLEMREKFPEVTTVVTGNADSNAPMLSINHRLGFKPHRESSIGQLNVQDLENYLASKQEKSVIH